MWAKIVGLLFSVAGVGFLNYLVVQEFEGVTSALFLIFSLLCVIGLSNVTLNGRPKDRSGTSD